MKTMVVFNLRFTTKKERKEAIELAKKQGISFNKFILNYINKEKEKGKNA